MEGTAILSSSLLGAQFPTQREFEELSAALASMHTKGGKVQVRFRSRRAADKVFQNSYLSGVGGSECGECPTAMSMLKRVGDSEEGKTKTFFAKSDLGPSNRSFRKDRATRHPKFDMFPTARAVPSRVAKEFATGQRSTRSRGFLNTDKVMTQMGSLSRKTRNATERPTGRRSRIGGRENWRNQF